MLVFVGVVLIAPGDVRSPAVAGARAMSVVHAEPAPVRATVEHLLHTPARAILVRDTRD